MASDIGARRHDERRRPHCRTGVTQETALGQVKSAASQSVLDDYIRRFEEAGKFSRLIFVCHSPRGVLKAAQREDVTISARSSLAETTVRYGLIDWLIARAG
jgi:hypothetical protein